MQRKCSNVGIPLNHLTLYTLSFADHQIVIAQYSDDIKYITRKLIEEYEKWTFQKQYLNVEESHQILILENCQRIQNYQNYTYLGVNITNNGTLKDGNIYGRKAVSMLNSILWD